MEMGSEGELEHPPRAITITINGTAQQERTRHILAQLSRMQELSHVLSAACPSLASETWDRRHLHANPLDSSGIINTGASICQRRAGGGLGPDLEQTKRNPMNARRSEYPLCRHTKTDGRLCQSPACGASPFCYFHKKLHRTRRSTIDSGPTLSPHILHPLRNTLSIQHALSMVVAGLATGQLRPAQAGKMLYALQLARANPYKTFMG